MVSPIENLSRKVVASSVSSEDWAALPASFRQGAFFSAKVEEARLLQRMKELLEEFMRGDTEEVTLRNGQKSSVKKVQGKSDFIRKVRAFMDAEGISKPGQYRQEADEVGNIGARSRLSLIFDVQTRSAYAQARFERGMTTEALSAYPAARFVRYPGAKTKRLTHVANEGVVRLKTDFDFWALEMNSRELGGFEVPWAPYGFNSYMDTQEVSREEAMRLGIISRGWAPNVPDISRFGATLSERVNKGMSASVKGIPEELKGRLRQKLREKYGADAIDIDGRISFPSREASERAFNEARRKQKAQESAIVQTHLNLLSPIISTVGEKLAFAERGVGQKVRESVETARESIDQVHTDGPLPEATISQGRSSSTLGSFNPFAENPEIIVSSAGEHQSLTACHEIGHFIDLWGLGKGRIVHESVFDDFETLKKRHYASEFSPELEEWRTAVLASKAIEELARKYSMSPSYVSYLLRSREIFARSYAQFIAEESMNETLLRELIYSRKHSPYTQWTTRDFKPIRDAFRNLFRAKGWMN